ncbi:MAG: hypothetical protein HQL71_12870 [Magnetococcales bacterium]|nr:hypothetical protein [Magnetococcales bacterium]
MDMSSEACWEYRNTSYEAATDTMVVRDNIIDEPLELYVSFCFDNADSMEVLTGDIILTNLPNGSTLNIGKAGYDNTWIISRDYLEVTEVNKAGNPIGWEIPNLKMYTGSYKADFYLLGIRVTVLDGNQINKYSNNIKVSRNVG